MASDLPNRPPADPTKKTAPVEATDRVKPVTEKTDPRFEAARQKAAKEDALRAKANAAQAGDADADADAEAPAAEEKPKSGFSFSNTTEDDQ